MIPDKYKDLKSGIIYIEFANNEILTREEAGKPIYKSIRIGSVGQRRTTSKRFSANGNRFLRKIAFCERCGCFKRSMQMLKSLCSDCSRELRLERIGTPTKKPKKKKVRGRLTALQIAFNITGDYPRVYRNFNIVDGWDDVFREIESQNGNI